MMNEVLIQQIYLGNQQQEDDLYEKKRRECIEAFQNCFGKIPQEVFIYKSNHFCAKSKEKVKLKLNGDKIKEIRYEVYQVRPTAKERKMWDKWEIKEEGKLITFFKTDHFYDYWIILVKKVNWRKMLKGWLQQIWRNLNKKSIDYDDIGCHTCGGNNYNDTNKKNSNNYTGCCRL